MHFFTTTTANLLSAEPQAGVKHHVPHHRDVGDEERLSPVMD
jgi:hypothetical protein